MRIWQLIAKARLIIKDVSLNLNLNLHLIALNVAFTAAAINDKLNIVSIAII